MSGATGASGPFNGTGLAPSESALRRLARLVPFDVLFYVDTEAPAFALTFDDGPHPDVTPPLLDVLRAHQANATFFLIGERITGNESVVGRMAAEGHELGNHLMRDEMSARLAADEFQQHLAGVTSLLEPHGDVRWFRPGSGWFTPRMLRSAAEQGLGCVLGTMAAGEYGGAGEVAAGLSRRIQPGSIVVLHEGTAKRRDVVAETARLLTEMSNRGLRSVTVSDLVALGS